jgi:hypothetical protein
LQNFGTSRLLEALKAQKTLRNPHRLRRNRLLRFHRQSEARELSLDSEAQYICQRDRFSRHTEIVMIGSQFRAAFFVIVGAATKPKAWEAVGSRVRAAMVKIMHYSRLFETVVSS